MQLPRPRGRLSQALFDRLGERPADLPPAVHRLAADAVDGVDTLTDEDVQITLWACQELHYRGFDLVDPDWEWQPGLLRVRLRLERALERDLHRLVPEDGEPPEDVPRALWSLTGADDGPSVSAFCLREATLEQFRELVIHRSVFHLKEGDPHTWAIPRLAGPAKAALVEIQADEYGNGRPGRMHSSLFADMMRALGLHDLYGHYVDRVSAATLCTNTVMSLFGLRRRWRGAVVGHLAAIEMTSTEANRRYANGLRRLGLGSTATRYFDEHVEADAVHEQIAAHDLVGALAATEPDLAGDILFGARCCLALDRLVGEQQLAAWRTGRSSLLSEAPAPSRPGSRSPCGSRRRTA